MATEVRWTVDDVLRLAPDAKSGGAARRLSLTGVWSQLGSSGTFVWGRCQGSAAEPYQVTVDAAEPAFRCTCPSRKHPCKHALALLLLWAAGEGSVAEDARPADFAAEWVHRLAAGAAGEPGRRAAAGGTAPDPEAQARRLAERLATMDAGVDEFERWLFDLVRQGLASARHQPYSFWDAAAARLVDAHLPGLAERVRALPAVLYAPGRWADDLLAELARAYLAVCAWRRRTALPSDVEGDLRVVLGWARRTEEILAAGERVTDRWAVVGLRHEGDARIQSQRTWLLGERTGRLALLLDFAAAGATLAVPQVLGSVVEAELALYPGSEPRRALFTGDRPVVGTVAALPGTDIGDALDAAASALAANPFADRVPMLLRGVVPVPLDAGPAGGDGLAPGAGVPDGAPPVLAVDGAGRALRLHGGGVLLLLAVSGGEPVDLFGEWDGESLRPVTAAAEGGLVGL